MTEHAWPIPPTTEVPPSGLLVYVTTRKLTFPWTHLTPTGVEAERYPSLLHALACHPNARVSQQSLATAAVDVAKALAKREIAS